VSTSSYEESEIKFAFRTPSSIYDSYNLFGLILGDIFPLYPDSPQISRCSLNFLTLGKWEHAGQMADFQTRVGGP
jgi:hypothetical protein